MKKETVWLDVDAVSLWVWNSYPCFIKGSNYAKQFPDEEAIWLAFLRFCLDDYDKGMKDYKARVHLSEWGTVAARLRSEFLAHLKECEEE